MEEKKETENALDALSAGQKIENLFAEARGLLSVSVPEDIQAHEKHIAEIMARLEALGAAPSKEEIAKTGPKIWDTKTEYAMFRKLFFKQMQKAEA